MNDLRALLVAVLGLAATLTTGFVAPPSAAAEEPTAYVRVGFDSIDPALPTRDGTIRLTGRVTNVADVELSNLRVFFWRSRDPINDREGMDQALASAANEPLGQRLSDQPQLIPSPEDRTLDPGESAPFTLTVAVADLDLPRGDHVFLAGVHVRGYNPELGTDNTVGRGRLFLPLVSGRTPNALQMTSVVVMTSQPSLLSDNVLTDDHLAAELAPGGRLAALVRAADVEGMSFAVDPALVEEVQTMADGYLVRPAGGGEPVAGTGQAAAARWLTGFRGLLQNRDGYRLPYASPDLAALAHTGRTALLRRSEAAGRRVSLTAGLPLLVLPADGLADEATLAAADGLRPRAVLLSDVSTDGRGPLLGRPDRVPVVSFGSAAFAGGPGPDPRDSPPQVQQRTLADTWIEATTAPVGATLGRVRVITDAAQAQSDDTDVAAPWTRRTPLSRLLAGRPSRWSGELVYPDQARTAELPAGQVSAAARLSRDFGALRQLVGGRPQIEAAAVEATARAVCSCWRAASDSAAAYTRAFAEPLARALDSQVSVSASPRVITAGRRGQFGVTVRNGLVPSDRLSRTELAALGLGATAPGAPAPNPVTVRVEFASANAQRLRIEPITFGPIPAGASDTQNAQVVAETNGTVQVRAQLVTSDGVEVGRPATIDVQVTQAGTIGWIIVVVAGVVLVGTTFLRIRQVTRERAAAGVAATPPALVVSRPPEEIGDHDHPTREPLDV